jgi:hypothetical protein
MVKAMPACATSSFHDWVGATLVAPATRVAPHDELGMPRPAHHDGVSPVISRRRGTASSHASCALQPLENKALRASHADWHRDCLLLEHRTAADLAHVPKGCRSQEEGGVRRAYENACALEERAVVAPAGAARPRRTAPGHLCGQREEGGAPHGRRAGARAGRLRRPGGLLCSTLHKPRGDDRMPIACILHRATPARTRCRRVTACANTPQHPRTVVERENIDSGLSHLEQ